MTKISAIRKIEEVSNYTKVRIDKNGKVTGMLESENYRYHSASNTGGRRFLGYMNEVIDYYQI
jgi:hypothetical protein